MTSNASRRVEGQWGGASGALSEDLHRVLGLIARTRGASRLKLVSYRKLAQFILPGGCHSAGFVDGAMSVEACQATCQANRDCRYFSYHVDRPDKRCHLCKDDRPHPKCFSSAARAADPTLHECYWGPKYCRRDDLGTRPDGKRKPIISFREPRAT